MLGSIAIVVAALRVAATARSVGAAAARAAPPTAEPEHQGGGVTVNYTYAAQLGFWLLEGQRIGVSYRFGDGLDAVRVNLGFPF